MLIQTLHKHAISQPESPAIHGASISLTYAQLLSEIEKTSEALPGICLALLMDNGPEFAVADLAAWQSNITCVPLPTFFSSQQLQHTLNDARIDMVLTDQPERIYTLCKVVYESEIYIAGSKLTLMKIRAAKDNPQLKGIAKVTYTSGTTGQPKGVCLRRNTIEKVVESLCVASVATDKESYLSLLPLSTLLENIGAIYLPIVAGAQSYLLPLQQVGLIGAAQLQPLMLLKTLNQVRPTSIILIPQLLQALVEMGEAGYPLPNSLNFIAIGGAPVSDNLMRRALKLGLPVFEGYGLSEAGSVVTLNTEAASRSGSVGKPLPHINVEVAQDGEIWIRGNLFEGYLGKSTTCHDGYATGDLGYIDDDGFLYLTGRKKNIFITAFGRNVSPEWVECELTLHPVIKQAAVFGEARPFNVVVIVPTTSVESQAIQSAIDEVNAVLPDYAQIRKFILADEPFSITNDELTGTARLRREVIKQHYFTSLNNLYDEAALA